MPAPKASRRQLGQELAEGAEHDGERAAGEAEADEDAGREVEHSGVVE